MCSANSTTSTFRTRPEAASRLRVIVLGYIVRGPLGGLAWHHLQYVLGLARCGHDVYFVEDSDDFPSCYDPTRGVVNADPTYGLEFTRRAFRRVGLADRWAYYDAHTARWLGPASDCIVRLSAHADLLLNISGVNPIRAWFADIPARALVDTDPVFTQVRHLTDAQARERAAQHTAFLSFGENIGRQHSAIPDDGFPWQPTRQPVVLDAWPVTPGPADGRFTTVMQWDSYPPREHNGRRYGMKSDSFGSYLDLPRRSPHHFELALGSTTAPRALLRRHGWRILDPLRPTKNPWAYQRYIQRSKGEFTVAKHGYVVGHSGWFSERSVAYLASGRPVITQETGFSDWLNPGAGILPFVRPEEALAAIDEVCARYDEHCRAARVVAEEFFDAQKVLPRLLEAATRPASLPPIDGAEFSSALRP
jgi:hypothetical protein